MNTEKHWNFIGRYPHHGIVVHLSSLRSQQSSGIGEYLDLLPLIQWCQEVGFDIIQLLPINESGIDPSPYNAHSSLALDPIFLSLQELGIEPTSTLLQLTEQKRVLRIEVLEEKIPLLRTLFEKSFSSLKQTEEYRTFLQKNRWLEGYSLFKALKEQFDYTHWMHWPQDYALPDPIKIDFYNFLQFHCFRQMKMVSETAKAHNVYLMGDLPILLNPDSADVWEKSKLFDLSLSAGAPPDDFNPLGQDWGFPLFNLKEMEKTDFQWWKARLKVFEQFFQLYRIDHVVGLFRIWGIKRGDRPDEGDFYPKQRSEWVPNGRRLLKMLLDATHLLPIAEDLGTISDDIFQTLKQLEIPGIKIIQTEAENGGFVPVEEYEPDSMTTISTHDMPTFQLWWRNYPEQSAPFAKVFGWDYDPFFTQDQRKELLYLAHHTPSLFHINLLQEYLALFEELVALNLEDERINVPGTILPTNWTYRYRPFVEEICNHEGLKKALKAILRKPLANGVFTK